MIYIAVFSKLIEPPRDRLPKERQLFSNTDLRKLIVPIIIEQVLVMMVGMVGTMMVSYSGEAAMSGVSLSEMINGIFQYVFSALAAGGTIVVSQYIGSRDMNKAQKSSNQLVMVATLIALIFMGGVLIGNRPLLSLLFGRIEADVMDAALTYLIITAFSYPFVAAYNAFSALFRAMGHSKINMKVSLMMNIINVFCNYIGVFRMGGGAEAVGISVLISRVFAAAVLFVLLLNKKYEISHGILISSNVFWASPSPTVSRPVPSRSAELPSPASSPPSARLRSPQTVLPYRWTTSIPSSTRP